MQNGQPLLSSCPQSVAATNQLPLPQPESILACAGDVNVAAKVVASIAERVNSGRIPLSMQSAHSANSELAAYTNVSKLQSRERKELGPKSKMVQLPETEPSTELQ